MNRWLAIVCAVVTVHLAGAQTGAEQYVMHGMVMKIDVAAGTMVVSHEAVSGLMGAMMMPFPVRDRASLQSLQPGMNVEFTLVVEKDAAFAINVRERPYEPTEPDPLTARRLALLRRMSEAPAARPLAVGDQVPDFNLLDQTRTTVRLSALRGKVVAINFVYTSCALPQFCLRTANNFAVLEKRLSAEVGGRLVLLTITFDPRRDSPEVLREYAEQWHADARGWHFLTGDPVEVQRVMDMAGMAAFTDEGLLDHAVRHLVIDRTGRLAANVDGNRFTVDQLTDLVRTVLDR